MTIRALQLVGQYQRDCQRLLDKSLQPDYLLDLAQQWLTLVLNMITALIVLVVTCFATEITTSSHAGLVGASLVSLMTLSELACATVRSWVQLETSLGAVKRLKDFEEIPAVDVYQGMDPPGNWPSSGHIKLDGVSASYSREKSNDHFDLQDIHLSISGGRKIAIVGRTGR
jgi:ATP-binding cassette, subfamily C (CFTR/MRP), member 1